VTKPPLPLDESARTDALRLLVEQMPAVLWSVDRDLRFTCSIGAGLAGLHQQAGDVIGMHLTEYFREEGPHFRPLEFHRRALAGESLSFEVEWMKRTFAAHVEPLRGTGGEITGVIGVALDITERKQAEQELQCSLSLLRATLDATADGILVIDENGKLVSFNGRFVEMWRLPEGLLESWDHSQALEYVLDQLKDPATFVKHVMGLYARPDVESMLTVDFKDGRVFERYSRPRSLGGKNAGRVLSFRDVTEKTRAERELSQTLSLLRATLDSTAEGILVVDTGGNIVSYNRRFVDMWGIPDEIVALRDDQKALTFVLDQLKKPEKFVRKTAEVYNSPESQSFDWLEFKDGRIFERYSQPQKIGGQTVGRVWSFRDVSERRRAEDALKRQARAMDHTFDAVVFTDLDGRITEWNGGACRIFGCPRDEALGKSLEAFFPAEEPMPTASRMLAGMRQDGQWFGDVRYRRADGSAGSAQARMLPMWDEFGRTVEALMILREVEAPRNPKADTLPVGR
jgi:PAS domain S-box-containing protein